MNARVGHGYDLHRFTTERPLVLGGVKVPHHAGLAAHSDGDAVIHAIADAILGAAGLGDIGRYFPDTPDNANMDSAQLLVQVNDLLAGAGYRVGNVDVTIITEEPAIAPVSDAMRQRLAALLRVGGSQVNIKATTNEGLGPVGAGEALAAHAVVMILPA